MSLKFAEHTVFKYPAQKAWFPRKVVLCVVPFLKVKVFL